MIRWYPRLLASYDNGLLRHQQLTDDSLIICRQGKEFRSFSMFTPIYTFGNYLLSLRPEERNFYEVVTADTSRKPYFDIDIDDPKVSIEDSKTLIFDLKESILVDSRISEDDILIFSSHGPGKISYHVIVDQWCLPDYHSNHVYCTKIISRIQNPLKKYIDDVVYKNIQQLRTFGSTKWGKSRFKILESKNSWLGECSGRARFLRVLFSSLLSNTRSCKILEYSEKVKKVYHSDLGDLTKDDLEILEKLPFIEDETFSIVDIKGRLVSLKRNKASWCDICNRDHEAENPFLIFNEASVNFFCRRIDHRSKIVWRKDLRSLEDPPKESNTFNKSKFLKKFLGKK